MQTADRAVELETELALAHDALQDWRTLSSEMSNSADDDSWRWVQAAEEKARSRQEAVLRSLISYMHTKQAQMEHHRGRRGSSDGGRPTAVPPSPSGRRLSIAPEDMMGRSKSYKEYSGPYQPRKVFQEPEKTKEILDEEDDTMSEEEEKRNEAKLRQVEQLVRRMSVHLEETVNISAPRVKPTEQDVKTSSRMVQLRR